MRSKIAILVSMLAASAASQSTTSTLQQTPTSANMTTTTINVWLYNLSPANVTFPVSASVVDGGSSSGAKNWTTYSLSCNTAEPLCRDLLNGLTYVTGTSSARWTSSGGDTALFAAHTAMLTTTHTISSSATAAPAGVETVMMGTTRNGSCGVMTGCVNEDAMIRVEKGVTERSTKSTSTSVTAISSIPLTVTASILTTASTKANATTSSDASRAPPTSTSSSTGGGIPGATGGVYVARVAAVAAMGGMWAL
ncbi:hypothetical protein GGTG_13962 [Gaeumannomyces tritici R3-111a-1]|uniref:GPI anchored protein n=1 Tax=Gaeumannomyces tritici (strain R3-111a-1) TaxID=644352 RepID=J3PKB2_GAET3|nr:hypothetical protein GGTG_13962 [Gaeumannomyces tritici R3-111a-1]EJT68463.1 hypothetical protein GGTG_13962 [Gaeumannomyces tritici R3-111a-1]